MAAPTHLIIVCCHGIYTGDSSKGHSESEWLIADFQKGETPTFVEHVRAGLECLARRREESVLAFSGAPTRRETSLSEARSYANLALQNSYFNLLSPSIKDTDMMLEERALDSFHNIFFSITLFWERFRAWPDKVTVVSHAFKRERIRKHCEAIGLPRSKVSFVGIDPPLEGLKKEDTLRGEGQALDDWEDDPWGEGEKLAGKRARRNAWGVWQGDFGEGVECERGELCEYYRRGDFHQVEK